MKKELLKKQFPPKDDVAARASDIREIIMNDAESLCETIHGALESAFNIAKPRSWHELYEDTYSTVMPILVAIEKANKHLRKKYELDQPKP